MPSSHLTSRLLFITLGKAKGFSGLFFIVVAGGSPRLLLLSFVLALGQTVNTGHFSILLCVECLLGARRAEEDG